MAIEEMYNIYQGIKQKKQAKKIDTTRPTYNIPSEVGENQQMYRDLANSGRMPGQTQAENNIKQGTANSINAISQTGGGVNNILASIGGLNQNQNNSMNQLSVQAAQFRQNNMDKLANANMVMAQYRDNAFDYNVNQPYMQRYARKMALEEASMKNIQNGVNGFESKGYNMMASKGSGGGGGGGSTPNYSSMSSSSDPNAMTAGGGGNYSFNSGATTSNMNMA